MIYYISFFFILAPIAEWYIHLLLHKFNNWNHLSHHEEITKNVLNKKEPITLEIWPIFPIIICYYFGYIIQSLCFFKYYFIHSILHFYPNAIPSLTNHHITHHKYSKYNFCVTNIWPDILFNTKYKKIKY